MKRILPLILSFLMIFSIACSNAEQTVKIEFEQQIVSLTEGETKQIELKTFKINNVEADTSLITFSTEQTDVIDVSGKEITAKAEGKAIVTASYMEVKESFFVSVEKIEPVVSTVTLELENDFVSLKVGDVSNVEIATFKIDDVDADKSLITFSTEQTDVIDVSGNEITAKAEGKAIVTASYLDTQKSLFVTVEKLVPSINIELANEYVALNIDETKNIDVETFTIDGVNADKSLIEFSSSNSNVAVVENGKIKGIGAGNATINVKYKTVTEKIFVMVDSLLDTASNSDIEEMNSNAVKIHGRYTRDANNNLVFDNVNSGIEIWFYGTECKVNFNVAKTTLVAGGKIQYSFLRVYLDDEIKEGYQVDVEELNVPGKLVALSTFGEDVTYTLASGLEEGFHRIQILKASEQKLNGDTRWTVTGLNSDVNCRILKAKGEKQLKIDFFGDSISCGAGALGDKNQNITNTNGDGTKTYASFTARALNADCSVVSKSGLCVAAELVGANLSLKNRWDCVSIHNDTKYDIDESTDLVVINLGTNDTAAVNKSKTTYAQITEDIVTTLTAMKIKYPNAKFVWCYGMMNEIKEAKDAIVSALNTLGGEQAGFYYLTTTVDTTGGDTHPTVNGHIATARVLVKFIEEKNIVESPRTGVLSEKDVNIVSDFGVAGKVDEDFGVFEYSNVTKDKEGNADWGLVPGNEWGAYTSAGTGYITYKLEADEGYYFDDLKLTFNTVHGHCSITEYFGKTNLKIYTSTDNQNWTCVYDLARIKYSMWNTKTNYNDCKFDCSETSDGESMVYIKFELVHPNFSGLTSAHQEMELVANSSTQKIALNSLGVRLHKVAITGRQIKVNN